MQDFVDKTLRLVRISLLISTIQRVLRFFSESYFRKSNRKLFSSVCIAWYKHSRRWENSWWLCKPSTSCRVCITVSNSPNPSRIYIRQCKNRKRFLLLKKLTVSIGACFCQSSPCLFLSWADLMDTSMCFPFQQKRSLTKCIFFYEWSLQWQEANYCGLVTVPSPIKEMVQTTSIYLPYSFRTRVRFLLHCTSHSIDKKGWRR